MDLQLAGRVALVTGSSRGTGAGIARVLAREGAHVVVSGADEVACERIAAQISKDGGKVSIAAGDVASADGAEAVIAALVAARLEVDVLVNNYGTAERGFWSTATDADWLTIYEKNVVSGVRLVRALVPGMKRAAGAASSSSAPSAAHGQRAHAALLRRQGCAARHDRGPGQGAGRHRHHGQSGESWPDRDGRGDRECPPSRHQGELAGGRRSRPRGAAAPAGGARHAQPVGRIATTEEVGELVAFLAGSRAAFITGQNIRIDGGAVDVTV